MSSSPTTNGELDRPDCSPAVPTRGWRAYRILFGIVTGIIVLVFLEPTLERLLEGRWRRGKFVYVNTLSLDVHATMGYAFVSTVLVQLSLGFRRAAGRGSRRAHAWLGRALVFALVPLFVLTGVWVVLDRSTSIAPEVSVIFKHHRPMARLALFELLGFVSLLVARSIWAIRRGDVRTHVDSIVGAFMAASAIVIIRFLYFLFWSIRGGSPLSVMGMFFLTVLVVVGALALVYGLAGRFQHNRRVLGALIGITAAFAVLGAPHYDLLDR